MRNIKPLNKLFIVLTLGAFLLSACDKPVDSSSNTDTSSEATSTPSIETSSDTSGDTSSSTSADTSSNTSTNSSTSSSTSGGSGHYEMPSEYASYYSTLSSSPTSAQLRAVVSTHTKYSYSSLADVMTQTDRDWKLSPNASDSNPYMRLIYASYNFNASNAAKRSDYNTIWDKEHIWAKSHGGSFDTGDLPGCDLHHLRASDKPNNNNHRNSRNFGNATGGTVGKDYRGGNSGKYSGDNMSGIYEPLLQDKGDVARACFYMALVYPSNCTIVNSYPGGGTTLGHLSTLLQWHELDPVDEFEMNRNNIIYNSYQRNRNPFIDHPEWADLLF